MTIKELVALILGEIPPETMQEAFDCSLQNIQAELATFPNETLEFDEGLVSHQIVELMYLSMLYNLKTRHEVKLLSALYGE